MCNILLIKRNADIEEDTAVGDGNSTEENDKVDNSDTEEGNGEDGNPVKDIAVDKGD